MVVWTWYIVVTTVLVIEVVVVGGGGAVATWTSASATASIAQMASIAAPFGTEPLDLLLPLFAM
jgi:hypothetical protein